MGPVASGSIQQNPEGGDGVARTSNIKKGLLISLTGIIGFLCAVVMSVGPIQTAQAFVNTIAGGPTPTCPSGYVYSATGCSLVVQNTATVSNPTVSVGRKSVSANALASASVHILADVKLKTGTQLNSPRCHWTKGPWSNSGHNGGGLSWFIETTPGYLCPNKNSPTGWVKVKGGKSGRVCFNPAKDGFVQKPYIKGDIIWVNSLNLRVPLKAQVSVSVGEKDCRANASAMASATIILRQFVRSRGSVSANVFGSVVSKLKAQASASVNCPTTTVTTPGTTTVVTTPGTTTVVTQPPTTTTVVTQPPTTTTTPPPPATRRCTISAHAEKSDPYTAYVAVDTEGTGTPSSTFYWGDGTAAMGTTSGIHTYPKPAPGPAGTGVTYRITVSATFADGQVRDCGSRDFFVPAPPPNGNTGPPPLP